MKDKKKKKSFKEFINSKAFLTVLFLSLLVLVAVLIALCFMKKDEQLVNMVIPVSNEDSNFNFSINAKMLEENTYTFKITNYIDNTINANETEYQIEINNATSSDISIYKDDIKKTSIESQRLGSLAKEKLHIGEKENIYYSIKINNPKKIKEDELIHIRIYN